MRNIALAIAAAAVAGCATWGQMNDGLNGLLGKPIDAAIRKIGYPASEQAIAGRKLYRWGGSHQSSILVPTTTTTTGTIGLGRQMTPFSATTTGMNFEQYEDGCYITLEVDREDIITRYQYEGNLDGCAPFIRALKK